MPLGEKLKFKVIEQLEQGHSLSTITEIELKQKH